MLYRDLGRREYAHARVRVGTTPGWTVAHSPPPTYQLRRADNVLVRVTQSYVEGGLPRGFAGQLGPICRALTRVHGGARGDVDLVGGADDVDVPILDTHIRVACSATGGRRKKQSAERALGFPRRDDGVRWETVKMARLRCCAGTSKVFIPLRRLPPSSLLTPFDFAKPSRGRLRHNTDNYSKK